MANSYYRTNPAPACSSCADCVFLKDCGGLEGNEYRRGCFQRCEDRCKTLVCDCVCPCAPVGFDDWWKEVGGICTPPSQCQTPSLHGRIPRYVPQVLHGSNRTRALFDPVVAIPLSAITRRRRGHLEVAFGNQEELCASLKISRRAKLLLTCVAPDALIEDFWHGHQAKGLLSQISRLKFLGVTVPNYSFMLDTPRTNSLFNLSRIFRMIERMSEAQIPTIPHINASNATDWNRWAQIFETFPLVQSFSLEFQTGLRNKDRCAKFLNHMEVMVQKLGRKMHPVVLAGTGRMQELGAMFDGFTIVDSTPFMKTMHRQKLVTVSNDARPRWRLATTQKDECLSMRLAENISAHRNFIYQRAGITDGYYLQQKLQPAA